MRYIDTAAEIFKEASITPQPGSCCATTPTFYAPGLYISERMKTMIYGCGSTVNARDLVTKPTILYVGIGGGLELLQFSYFSQRKDLFISESTCFYDGGGCC